MVRGKAETKRSIESYLYKRSWTENLIRAGHLKRALFVCDRDELRSQALAAFQNVFGADAAEVYYEEADGKNHARNARIHIATYQTLDVDTEDGTANFLTKHYPPDYFSPIIIDECHRSAWGKWSQVLTRNPNAVQIGLTATPRTLEVTETSQEAEADQQITADNIRHFGEPVYEYDIAQGIEDGYLAACEIHRIDLFLDDKPETEGIGREDLTGKTLTDADTGQRLSVAEARARYAASDLEDKLLLPERVAAMCQELFSHLCETGGPEQKTIIFCARDRHADAVAAQMNNLYADWCRRNNCPRVHPYALVNYMLEHDVPH
ncbi:MAG: DEAD/DEAH box helicase family protein [Candidatus Methanomethylicaceae archaeon]